MNAGGIHYEPFGIYPGTKSDLTTLEEGDEIAVPNDTTNEARALLLLQDNGIITLAEGAGLTATKNDIVENPYGIEILELEAAQVPRVVEEVAFAVMNGNYALNAGFSVANDSIAYESADSEAAKTYVNVIAVKEGNEESEGIVALVETLKSQEMQDFINETYDGAVIPFVESDDAEARQRLLQRKQQKQRQKLQRMRQKLFQRKQQKQISTRYKIKNKSGCRDSHLATALILRYTQES